MATDVLKITLIVSVAQPRPPIVFHSEQTVEEVMDVMHQNQITSAPVLELSSNKLLGFIDMLDLVWFLLDIVHQGIPKGERMEQLRQKFSKEKNVKVVNSSNRSECYPLPQNSTLFDAAKLFKQGIHRIPVLNSSGEIVTLFSQSDMVAFLIENEEKLGDLWKQPVGKNPYLVHHKVQTVSKNKSVIEAYELLFTKGVNSVAVVDDNGVLVGNLSSTDLKGIYGRSFVMLHDKVEDFLRENRLKKFQGVSLKHPHYIATAKPDEAIGVVANRMKDLHVHRLFIVDNDIKPIGVVSLTDVIFLVTEQETTV